MELPTSLHAWLTRTGWGAVTHHHTLSGGSINTVLHLTTQHGPPLVLKFNPTPPSDFFQREVAGLQALASVPGAPRIPQIYASDRRWLLLEYLPPIKVKTGFYNRLGEELARLHQHTQSRFGFPHDNYIGLTPQPNGWLPDGYAFFAERRLRFQAHLARDNNLFSASDVQQIERLIARLPNLIPAQPASLIHGDLWPGNVIVGPQGEPVLVDPAAHYGWAEAELAMTSLFGGFSRAFYDAYAAAADLAPGWPERLPLYNLYHLINHLNLFGRSYYSQIVATLRRFA